MCDGVTGVMLDSVHSVTGKVQHIFAPKEPSSVAKCAKQIVIHCSFSHLANEIGPFGAETCCLTEQVYHMIHTKNSTSSFIIRRDTHNYNASSFHHISTHPSCIQLHTHNKHTDAPSALHSPSLHWHQPVANIHSYRVSG